MLPYHITWMEGGEGRRAGEGEGEGEEGRERRGREEGGMEVK